METLFIALRVVLSLGVVLGLLWVLQRRLSQTGRAKRSAGLVSVVTRQGISPKASVVVVDVDGTRFLLGVTDSAVTVLHSGDAPVGDSATAALAPVAELPSILPASAPTFPLASAALAAEPTSAGAFARSLSEASKSDASRSEASILDPDAAYRRPRKPKQSSALAGSVLSAATWRQAGAALRAGRAG